MGNRGGGSAGVVRRGYGGDRAIDGADAKAEVEGQGVNWGLSGFGPGAIPDVGIGKEDCGAEAVCGGGWSGKICNVGEA